MNNSIIAYYNTKFGELWDMSLSDIVKESIEGAIKNAGIEASQIDAIFFANMLSGVLENNLHMTSRIAEILEVNIPIFRIESACASGGTALHLANSYLNSGAAKTILVIGAEKMNDNDAGETTTGLMAAASGEEFQAGLTFPGLYGMLAQNYLHEFGYSEESLAMASVINHHHGKLNPKAQYRSEITIDKVLKSTPVASPLKLLDCSPITDGGAAIIMTNDEKLIEKNKSVKIKAIEVASDTISLKTRESMLELKATKIASQKAFAKAGLSPEDIDVAEVHDCFSIAELLALEDIGFWKKGEAGKKILEKSIQIGNEGKLKVNTSGGLKAAGHPVGATGIKQIGEIYLQLTNQADKRQVKNAKYGLAHNVGGSGGTASVAILEG